jgi:hypothetical protein
MWNLILLNPHICPAERAVLAPQCVQILNWKVLPATGATDKTDDKAKLKADRQYTYTVTLMCVGVGIFDTEKQSILHVMLWIISASVSCQHE